MELRLCFGTTASLEEQCNKQGFTLGSKQQTFQNYAEAISGLYTAGLLTDHQNKTACDKLYHRVNRAVRLLNPKK